MATKVEQGYQYTATHEWVRVEGSRAFVGVTDFAQHAMGNVVYVELPEAGKVLQAGEDFCVVESVKGAHDIFAPVSGTVAEVNGDLEDAPQKVNEDPYGSWIAVIDMSRPDELKGLMDAAAYAAHCENAPAH
ncbi:MAG: Glycine cleavage system H protein [Synergistetes bacterium ADurb.Bin520]|nr:MAG: Glycine cleavage system H protein [Synergistetes bacterium ADurb.Bin520]